MFKKLVTLALKSDEDGCVERTGKSTILQKQVRSPTETQLVHLEPHRWYTLPERNAGLVLDGAFYNNLPVSNDFYAFFIYGNTYEYFTGTRVSIDFLFHLPRNNSFLRYKVVFKFFSCPCNLQVG